MLTLSSASLETRISVESVESGESRESLDWELDRFSKWAKTFGYCLKMRSQKRKFIKLFLSLFPLPVSTLHSPLSTFFRVCHLYSCCRCRCRVRVTRRSPGSNGIQLAARVGFAVSSAGLGCFKSISGGGLIPAVPQFVTAPSYPPRSYFHFALPSSLSLLSLSSVVFRCCFAFLLFSVNLHFRSTTSTSFGHCLPPSPAPCAV